MAIEILKPEIVQSFKQFMKTSSAPGQIETSNPIVPVMNLASSVPFFLPKEDLLYDNSEMAAADTTVSAITTTSTYYNAPNGVKRSASLFVYKIVVSLQGGSAAAVQFACVPRAGYKLFHLGAGINEQKIFVFDFPIPVEFRYGEQLYFEKGNVVGSYAYIDTFIVRRVP